jgi:dTMP kinase
VISGSDTSPQEALLVALEGVSGSGKGALMAGLVEELDQRGHSVFTTSWNSDPVLSPQIGRLKYERKLSPLSWSLIHAAEFRRRYLNEIEPALKGGAVDVVIADRWVPTALTRDVIRGVPAAMVSALYESAPRPDLILYIDVPPDVALSRRLDRHGRLYYYSSGADTFGDDHRQSFLRYNAALAREYGKCLGEFESVALDGALSKPEVLRLAVAAVEKLQSSRTFGTGSDRRP